MIRIILFYALFLSFIVNSIAQNTQLTVNFELNEWKINQNNKAKLLQFSKTIDNSKITRVSIVGHTDAEGSESYNEILSKKRTNSVRQELLKLKISDSIIESNYYGESQLIEKIQGKSEINRRVEIKLEFETESKEIKSPVQSLESLLSNLTNPPQKFCINNNRDTIIRGEKGTIINLKANSVARIDGKPIKECVELELKEAYSKSDMILNNLTTTSNGKLLESEGMFNLSPSKNNTSPLKLVKDYVAFVPTDSIRSDVQVFDGHRANENNLINWIPASGGIGGIGFEDCSERFIFADGNDDETCRLFFCKIKKWIRKNKSDSINTTANSGRNNLFFGCDVLDGLLLKYGVTNYSELTAQMLKEEFDLYGVDNLEDYRKAKQQEIFDKYNVDNLEDLKKAITKEKQENFEQGILVGDSISQKSSLANLNYYIASFQGFGWKNIDAFSKLNASEKTNFTLEKKPEGETNLRLVFENYKIIAPITIINRDSFLAQNFPKQSKAWVVGININENGFFLAKQKITIDGTSVKLIFRKIEPEELRSELKILDVNNL